MDRKSVERLAEEKGSVCLEVFSSIVNSKSERARKTVDAAVRGFCERIVKANPGLMTAKSCLSSSFLDDLRDLAIEDFMVYSEVEDLKYRKSFTGLMMGLPFFSSTAIGLLAGLLDLNPEKIKLMKENSQDEYYQIGDGILLAGLYLNLKE
jgi:hypothetical protein